MITRPKLKSYLTTFPISDGTWGIGGGTDELWRLKLKDEEAMRTFSGILPYLNGKYSVDEIVEELGSNQQIEGRAVRDFLVQLEEMSFIEEDDSSMLSSEDQERFRHQISFFSRFTSSGGAKYQAKIREARIGLVENGQLSESVLRALSHAGFGEIVLLKDPATGGPKGRGDGLGEARQNGCKLKRLALDRDLIRPPDMAAGELPMLIIVPQEAHDPLLLEAMDTFSKKHDVPWMLIRCLDPHEGWVGPLFIPHDTPSYLSLEARLRGNVPFFEEYDALDRHLRKQARISAAIGGLTPFFDQLSAIAVIEVIKYITEFNIPHLAGKFLTVNMLSWETELHHVLRVPRLEEESYTHPGIFPWKGVPYADAKTRRS